MKAKSILSMIVLFALACCTATKETSKDKSLQIEFEKYSLDNGLQVILHIDRSDPVVAVALTAHVGSAREKVGRTGFAHLFEHLLFLESENLGKGGLDKMSARIGGSGANGSTSRDVTNYFQTVPNDAVEKMIWAEADKLGFFINTVTDPVLSKEKEVVKNEKRERGDNQPYGHTPYVVYSNLYPSDHPYNWDVIGSLEDLQNATLADVKEFYNKWYVPNNVTLSVAGDFDVEQVKQWIAKYFGEIKKGGEIHSMLKQPAVLTETKRLYHEDNFATLPELTLTWPGVPAFDEDSYALSILTEYLAVGKRAPLYKKLVIEKQLTSNIQFQNSVSEIAGELSLVVRAFENTDLNLVHQGIIETFQNFERTGISESDLNRIKAGAEVTFYNNLSSVVGKGFALSEFNIFTGDPAGVNSHVDRIRAVTRDDVMAVYKKYIKDKHFVATSFVPKGESKLILTGSKKADIVEEKIVQGAEDQFDASQQATYARTPSSFDRSVEPPYGKTPEVKVPDIWKDSLSNGVHVFGINSAEVPMVQFSIRVQGGQYLENADKTGVANLFAETLNKGTKNRTAEEFEEQIQNLGAMLSVSASDQFITISGSTLSRNYKQTIALVTEMLLEPRWDEKEFILAKQRVINKIQDQQSSPESIANLKYRKLLFGDEHILSNDILGTEKSLQLINMTDLKSFYEKKFAPSRTSFLVVGDVSREAVIESLSDLAARWKDFEISWPEFTMPSKPTKSTVYFYDIPGAKQSQIRFFSPSIPKSHPDYYALEVTNYILGGGGFASQLTQQLREGKGYTYGIYSEVAGSPYYGRFLVTSGVRSNVTLEASQLVKDILESYSKNFNEADLEVTKSFLIKSNARAFETARSKIAMLGDISLYKWPNDYLKRREEVVRNMTVDKIKALANQYITPDHMYYLVVGDGATQLSRLKSLKMGEPVVLTNAVDELTPR